MAILETFGNGSDAYVDFSEEDAHLYDMVDASDEAVAAEDYSSIYGQAVGWDEQQTGLHIPTGRPDQVADPLNGGLHTNTTRGIWLVGGTVIFES